MSYCTRLTSHCENIPQYISLVEFTPANILAMLLTVDGPGSGINADFFDGLNSTAFALAAHEHDSVTPAEVISIVLANDGAGSGLDADFLDGLSSAAFEEAGAVAAHVLLADPHEQYLLESAFVPPGADTQVLFNDGGAWGAAANMVWHDVAQQFAINTPIPNSALHVSESPSSSIVAQFEDGDTQLRLRKSGRYRGDARVDSSGLAFVAFDDTGGVYLPVAFSASDVIFYANEAASTISFLTNSQLQLRVQANGDVNFYQGLIASAPTFASFANSLHNHADAAGGGTLAGYATAFHAHVGSDITSGTVADARISASLSGKTLVTPTIASFANAAHTHQDAGGGGQLDHGLALAGLGDDDHPQYHNDARGDVRYPAIASYNAHVAAVSGVHGISAFGATVTGAATQAAGRSALGLGTMATEATGDWVSIAGAQTVSGVKTFSNGLITGKIYPSANSTAAVQVLKADGTTAIIVVDSTNRRVGVNRTPTTAMLEFQALTTAEPLLTFFDENANIRLNLFADGNMALSSAPATAVLTSLASGVLSLVSQRWTGAATAQERFSIFTERLDSGSGRYLLHFRNQASGVPMAISGGTFGQVAMGNSFPADAQDTKGKLWITSPAATWKALVLQLAASASVNAFEVMNSSSTVLALINKDGGFVFNENGADTDCRIEGDTDANLFFIDASADRAGFGTNVPNNKVDVVGTVQCDGLRVDVTPTAETPAATHTAEINFNGVSFKVLCLAA